MTHFLSRKERFTEEDETARRPARFLKQFGFELSAGRIS